MADQRRQATTIYYLIVVEDRSRQLVSQWALRTDDGTPIVAGQIVDLLSFLTIPRPLIASWVQYDAKHDVQEVDVGVIWIDELGPDVVVQLFWRHFHDDGWHQIRPPYEAR